jgi:hypothetical protein
VRAERVAAVAAARNGDSLAGADEDELVIEIPELRHGLPPALELSRDVHA